MPPPGSKQGQNRAHSLYLHLSGITTPWCLILHVSKIIVAHIHPSVDLGGGTCLIPIILC